jgi:hypothetical protein
MFDFTLGTICQRCGVGKKSYEPFLARQLLFIISTSLHEASSFGLIDSKKKQTEECVTRIEPCVGGGPPQEIDDQSIGCQLCCHPCIQPIQYQYGGVL